LYKAEMHAIRHLLVKREAIYKVLPCPVQAR